MIPSLKFQNWNIQVIRCLLKDILSEEEFILTKSDESQVEKKNEKKKESSERSGCLLAGANATFGEAMEYSRDVLDPWSKSRIRESSP